MLNVIQEMKINNNIIRVVNRTTSQNNNVIGLQINNLDIGDAVGTTYILSIQNHGKLEGVTSKLQVQLTIFNGTVLNSQIYGILTL